MKFIGKPKSKIIERLLHIIKRYEDKHEGLFDYELPIIKEAEKTISILEKESKESVNAETYARKILNDYSEIYHKGYFKSHIEDYLRNDFKKLQHSQPQGEKNCTCEKCTGIKIDSYYDED